MTEKCNSICNGSKCFIGGLVSVVSVALIAFFGANAYESIQTVDNMSKREMNVEAQGVAYITPNVANITLGVNSEGKTAEEVLKVNTEKINKLHELLKAEGVDKKDIQTTYFYMDQKYDWTEAKGNFTDGYMLNQQVSIKVKDFSKIETIITKSVSNGTNLIGGVNFSSDNIEGAINEARKEAMTKIESKKKLIEEATKIKLGKAVSLYEYQNGGYYDSYTKDGYYGEAMVAEVGPTIEPGQQKITLSVSVSYEIK